MTARGYALHGVRLGVTAAADAEPAARGIHARLAGLPLDGDAPHDLTFEILGYVAALGLVACALLPGKQLKPA